MILHTHLLSDMYMGLNKVDMFVCGSVFLPVCLSESKSELQAANSLSKYRNSKDMCNTFDMRYSVESLASETALHRRFRDDVWATKGVANTRV